MSVVRLAPLAIVTLALAAPAPARAAPEDPRVEFARRRDERAARADAGGLVRLAEWCRKQHLYAEEREALARALEVAPEHRDARRALAKLDALAAHHARYETPWRREANFLWVETNTSEARLHHYCTAFTAFYNAFRKLFGVKANPLALWKRKIGVRVFAAPEDFARYQRETGGELGESTVGYYDRERKELVLYDDPADPAATQDTLFHEGTHLLVDLALHAAEYDLPLWIEEGLAEYFGPSRFDPVGGTIQAGQPSPERLRDARALLGAARPPDLARLVGLEADRVDDFDVPDYALSWLLVHMLVEDADEGGAPRYRKAFVRCYERTSKGYVSLDVFREELGEPQAFVERLKAYLTERFR